MRVIAKYNNGNYKVLMFDDGSKIRYNDEDCLIPSFPESIDLKITNKCPYACEFCHENSTPDGKEARLVDISENGEISFAIPFLNTLTPGTELAIGGGSVMSHSQIGAFLTLLKQRKIIANFTVNQRELFNNLDTIQMYINNNLVHGVGISFTGRDDRLIDFCHRNKNAVIHIINGVISKEHLEWLSDKDLKVLVLGYKDFRRGKEYHNYLVDMKKDYLRGTISSYIPRFSVMSFDNLAIKQLELEAAIGKEEYDKMYMGNDGQFTMYIDLPNMKFAPSSVYPEEKRFDLLDDIESMFDIVRKEKTNESH